MHSRARRAHRPWRLFPLSALAWRQGQHTVEMVLTVATVSFAMVSGQVLVRRGLQARVKVAADDLLAISAAHTYNNPDLDDDAYNANEAQRGEITQRKGIEFETDTEEGLIGAGGAWAAAPAGTPRERQDVTAGTVTTETRVGEINDNVQRPSSDIVTASRWDDREVKVTSTSYSRAVVHRATLPNFAGRLGERISRIPGYGKTQDSTHPLVWQSQKERDRASVKTIGEDGPGDVAFVYSDIGSKILKALVPDFNILDFVIQLAFYALSYVTFGLSTVAMLASTVAQLVAETVVLGLQVKGTLHSRTIQFIGTVVRVVLAVVLGALGDWSAAVQPGQLSDAAIAELNAANAITTVSGEVVIPAGAELSQATMAELAAAGAQSTLEGTVVSLAATGTLGQAAAGAAAGEAAGGLGSVLAKSAVSGLYRGGIQAGVEYGLMEAMLQTGFFVEETEDEDGNKQKRITATGQRILSFGVSFGNFLVGLTTSYFVGGAAAKTPAGTATKAAHHGRAPPSATHIQAFDALNNLFSSFGKLIIGVSDPTRLFTWFVSIGKLAVTQFAEAGDSQGLTGWLQTGLTALTTFWNDLVRLGTAVLNDPQNVVSHVWQWFDQERNGVLAAALITLPSAGEWAVKAADMTVFASFARAIMPDMAWWKGLGAALVSFARAVASGDVSAIRNLSAALGDYVAGYFTHVPLIQVVRELGPAGFIDSYMTYTGELLQAYVPGTAEPMTASSSMDIPFGALVAPALLVGVSTVLELGINEKAARYGLAVAPVILAWSGGMLGLGPRMTTQHALTALAMRGAMAALDEETGLTAVQATYLIFAFELTLDAAIEQMLGNPSNVSPRNRLDELIRHANYDFRNTLNEQVGDGVTGPSPIDVLEGQPLIQDAVVEVALQEIKRLTHPSPADPRYGLQLIAKDLTLPDDKLGKVHGSYHKTREGDYVFMNSDGYLVRLETLPQEVEQDGKKALIPGKHFTVEEINAAKEVIIAANKEGKQPTIEDPALALLMKRLMPEPKQGEKEPPPPAAGTLAFLWKDFAAPLVPKVGLLSGLARSLGIRLPQANVSDLPKAQPPAAPSVSTQSMGAK